MSCLILIVFLIALYYALPIIFLISPPAFVPFIYLNWLTAPYEVSNFEDFKAFNITETATRNFYIKSEFDSVSLGIWQILPNEKIVTGPKPTDQEFLNRLNDNKPIFLYSHGVGFHRAVPVRIETYKLISNLGFHVFALDYRGFGDSGGKPQGEIDVVTDSKTVLKYIKKHAPSSKVILWGHSLGTGVTGSLYKNIQVAGLANYADGIFLDAAFDTFINAVYNFPIAKIYAAIIGLHQMFEFILNSINIHYETLENLKSANLPIMIVSSEDDEIIPHKFSVDLYNGLKAAGRDVSFTNLGTYGYGHQFNYKSPMMPDLIREFVKKIVPGT